MASRPENIGILAMELYVPPRFVSQKELEVYDGVSAGKYTIGLGQENLGFCGDNEDVISLSLTVVQRLLERNRIRPEEIGRVEVGTETVVDKSKSIKSVLMQLFEPSGNTDIGGADTTNACYGGTAALLNSVQWIDSSSWDGRLAIVVSSDIAVYAAGPARPTGGAGAVAMLVGPNAPLTFEHSLCATYASHVYDFYKPKPASEYPVVDGKLSQVCYVRALDECYKAYSHKYLRTHGKPFSLADTHRIVLHSPYNKLVQKGASRLVFNDVKNLNCPEYLDQSEASSLSPFLSLPYDATLENKDLEKASMGVTKRVYSEKVEPGTRVGKQVGNMYAASLYGALASVVGNQEKPLQEGERVLMFSYGSGLISSMFSLVFRNTQNAQNDQNRAHPSVLPLKSWVDLDALDKRTEVTPKEFVETMELMETRYGASDYVPSTSNSQLEEGVFYLAKVDELYRRFYERQVCGANGLST